MKKKNIKLIGLDLDGTLLRDDKTLDDKTASILSLLADNGIHIVPITGRPYKGLPKELEKIKGIRYCITTNGAQITDTKLGESICSRSISNDVSKKIIEILDKSECKYEVFCDHYGYCEESVFEQHRANYYGTPIWDYLFMSREKVESIAKIFDDSNKMADEIFIICNDSEEREKINQTLLNIDEIQICNLGERFSEVTVKGTDKGSALEILCKHIGIDTEETIAFGDGENDLQFLEKAGVSVAMKNAFDIVKERADFVTDSNNEMGVAKVLESYFNV